MNKVEGQGLMPSDVVQINPEGHESFFAGCFLLVTEVKGWGVQGFVAIPASERGKMPAAAYYRAKWDEIEAVCNAVWAPPLNEE